jgi:hypothetical protein
MNLIMVINPYWNNSAWVFDDAEVGLFREPFVAGIDKMIDLLIAGIPNAHRGFKMLFSANPFPDYDVKLEWRREDCGGNWYHSALFNMEGWLCPALFLYFKQAPKLIYVQALEREIHQFCTI